MRLGLASRRLSSEAESGSETAVLRQHLIRLAKEAWWGDIGTRAVSRDGLDEAQAAVRLS